MTITCPECGFSATIDPAKIPVAGTTASCPKCACRFAVESPAPPRPDHAEPLLVICPSCREEQPLAAACRRCSIIFARFRRPDKRRQEAPAKTVEYNPGQLLRRALVSIAVVLGLLLLWIVVKDLIPTTLTTTHETLGVTSGLQHSVAVRSDGTVWTWGDNTHGQLGNGRRGGGHAAPRMVPGIDTVIAVAAGDRHTLALKKDGTVWSWGNNEQGQLGDLSGTVGRTEPAQVAGLEGIAAISAGESVSAALRSDGTLWQFGSGVIGGGADGAVGNEIARPRQIAGISGVTSFSCGRKSIIALKDNGSVWCWGLNTAGQCGDGGSGIQWEPQEVAGLDQVMAVAAGEDFALALKKDGSVWGWGSLYIATGTNLQRQSRPAPIHGLSRIRDIKAGYWLALALRSDGTVWHSGAKTTGALGERRGFADILKRKKTAATGAIFAGGRDAFMEKTDGALLSWGLNDYGTPVKKGEKKEISLSTLAFEIVPTEDDYPAIGDDQKEPPGIQFRAIAAGSKHSLALAVDGTVWAWGENEAGQVTDGAVGSANSPRQICTTSGQPLDDVISIAAGANSSLAVRRDGSLWHWGQNLSLPEYVSSGRSGSKGIWSGAPNNNIPPTAIYGVHDALAVAGNVGLHRYVLLHGDGRLSFFGSFDKETLPLVVRSLLRVTDVAAVAAGAKHFAALKRDGTILTWGENDSGQLGDGTTTSRDTPRRVMGIGSVISLAAGNNVTLAVKKDGTVWGWGRNIYGITPKGLDVTSSHSPVRIDGLKEIVAVAVPGNGYRDSNHYLAVDRNGRVFTWGFNSQGQLGQGTKGHVTVRKPAMIDGLDGVTAVAAGLTHALALRSDGTIRSWGGNSSGQLGNGNGFDSAFPVGLVAAEKKQ